MDFDVVVVGAGTSGCLAARDLARRGLRVGLFDAARRERVGRPIIVEVERPVFSQVGLPSPGGDLVPYHPRCMRVFSPRRRPAFVLGGATPAIAVHLRPLTERLLASAEQAGARFCGGLHARRLVLAGQTVQGVVLSGAKREQEVRARLVVDATGHASALVQALPAEVGMEVSRSAADLVVAANYWHRIDVTAAQRAVRSGAHGDDELWVTLGPFGPYSTEFSHLSLEQRRAYVLIGHKIDQPGSSLRRRIHDHYARLGYYGERLVGGGGRIRIARALDRLVADGFAAVGEAASMVNPLIGSGVASGLIAAALLAEVAAQALATGAATTVRLWPYAAQYQRGRGATLASFDAMRRGIEGAGDDLTARLLESGVAGPEALLASNLVELRAAARPAALRRALALARQPALWRPVSRMCLPAAAVYAHYRRYPRRYDHRRWEAWCRRSRQLFAPLCASAASC